MIKKRRGELAEPRRFLILHQAGFMGQSNLV